MILGPIIRLCKESLFQHLFNSFTWFSLISLFICQGLGILKQKFPKVPVLALTATATVSVKEDVVQALGLVNCIVFRQSFNRPNLWSVPLNYISIVTLIWLICFILQVLCNTQDKEVFGGH